MSVTIFTSINPLLIASQFTGFNLFSIDTKKWKAVITLWDLLLIFKAILLNLIVHYVYFNSYFIFDLHGTTVVQSSIPKLIFVNLVAYTFAHVWLFVSRQHFVTMLKLAHEIDEKFLDFYLKFDYHKQKRRLIISIIAYTAFSSTLVLTARISLDYYEVKIPNSLSYVHFYSFICSMIIIHHLIVGFKGIQIRFEKLNFYIAQWEV